jgi:hypothetical protein
MGNDRGWIPTSECVPDTKTGFVLIYIDFHEPHTMSAVRLGYYDEQSEVWRSQIMGRLQPHWEVTHWMRLPEPPEAAV